MKISASRYSICIAMLSVLALLAGCDEYDSADTLPGETGRASHTAAAAPAGGHDPELTAKLRMERPIAAVDSPWLDELTWLEVRDRIASGVSTVIIPTGGVEENGPFLTTGKHNLILRATCPAIARMLDNALCAPVVKFVPEGDIDPPTGSMLFPGTISVRESTFVALLDDIASSLKQAGFTNIVLIGDSGGNQRGMEEAANALNMRWQNEPARAFFIREFYDPGWEATENYTREVLGVSEGQNDGHHDDIWVTAMMMTVDPEQVRYRQRLDAKLASINGVSIASLEEAIALGEAMIEFRARLTADAIRKALGAPLSAKDTADGKVTPLQENP